MPEFQRQVVIPNVQKCSLALLKFARSPETNLELKLLVIDTLTELTTHHPSHHRALQQDLHNLTLEHLKGTFPLASSPSLFLDTSAPSIFTSVIQLHAALPLTGGKVGSSVAWRKSVDSAMTTIWGVLGALRSTYGDVVSPALDITPFSLPALPDDPAIATPIALDRFRCMIRLLVHLLGTPTSRPVSVPLGSLMQLSLTLMRLGNNAQMQPTHTTYEAIQRVNQAAAIPELCVGGCMLAQQLARSCGNLFTPYLSQVFAAITFQLEQNITISHRQHLLATIIPLLANTHRPAPSQSYNRLAAQLLRVLSPLLPSSRTHTEKMPQQTPSAERKGKKRARYEGDELFSSHLRSSALNLVEIELYMAALLALAAIYASLPCLTQAMIQRTLLALLLHLPRMGAQSLALEVGRVYASTLGTGPSGTLGVGVHDSAFIPGSEPGDILHRFLHPRIPPNSRSGPTIDDIALFWKGEDEDEETKELRGTAGILLAKETDPTTSSEVSKPPNGVDRAVNSSGSGAEGQGSAPNNINIITNLAAQHSSPSIQPRSTLTLTSPPEHLTVSDLLDNRPTPSADITTPLPQPPPIAPPKSPKTTPSSTSFHSGNPPSTTQAPPMTSTPPVAGPSFSVSIPTNDDEDEPMPQIDLDSDTDEDET